MSNFRGGEFTLEGLVQVMIGGVCSKESFRVVTLHLKLHSRV